jgi:hypothetical protein
MAPFLPAGFVSLPSLRSATRIFGVGSLRALAVAVGVQKPPIQRKLRDVLIDFVYVTTPLAPVRFTPSDNQWGHPVDAPITWDDPANGGYQRALGYRVQLFIHTTDPYSDHSIVTNGAAHVTYQPPHPLLPATKFVLYATPQNPSSESIEDDLDVYGRVEFTTKDPNEPEDPHHYWGPGKKKG